MLRRLLVAGLLGTIGCQGGVYPLAPYGATKVPPPATGTIGRSDGYLGSGSPPGSDGIERTGRLPARGTDDGAWRPSDPPGAADRAASAATVAPREARMAQADPHPGAAAELPQGVQLSSRLTWLDPRQASTAESTASSTAAATSPPPARSAQIPRLLKGAPALYGSPTDPLHAPPPDVAAPTTTPRIRGFPAAGPSVNPLEPALETSAAVTGAWTRRR